jgi:CheY-like chemotaxis protein
VAEAVGMILEQRPQVVLLDVHMPDGGGAAVIAAVAPRAPEVRFLAEAGHLLSSRAITQPGSWRRQAIAEPRRNG